jgi:glyoxylase-like metal-dependent hydrolase (beta-lactamase superfamily II)
VETAPYGTNAYVVYCPETKAGVLVDAPGDSEDLRRALAGIRPEAILITHGHFDHIGGLEIWADRLQVPVAAHAGDAARLPRKPERFLEDGDVIVVGNGALEVLHTPGHTPGSLCFSSGDILLSGDTLFPGGPGRTATPADFRRILESLRRSIFILPEDTRVYPGHGEPTGLGREKRGFEAFIRDPLPPDLCGDIEW